ncbi:hypothetical protein ACSCBZ_21925 [Streptomyces niveiscabiei]|uniref:hypothetical protein n=1 Tax=Streptomyces niveiscabiei TaxID=164115 RepID=UPI003EC066F5
MTGTANAATSACFSQSYSDGAQVVPGTGGGHVTRAITRQQAGNTWDDWVWRGEKVECSRSAISCPHSWTQSQTVTTGWAVGGGINLGNSSSPSKKWYNALASVTGGYQKTTEISKTTTIGVTVRPGHTAQEVIVAVRRWTQGDYAERLGPDEPGLPERNHLRVERQPQVRQLEQERVRGEEVRLGHRRPHLTSSRKETRRLLMQIKRTKRRTAMLAAIAMTSGAFFAVMAPGIAQAQSGSRICGNWWAGVYNHGQNEVIWARVIEVPKTDSIACQRAIDRTDKVGPTTLPQRIKNFKDLKWGG